MNSHRKGFTLLELLVVIAIISIVFLCVTGAIRGAIKFANATKCQANMKNLHAATVAYLADHASYPQASSWEIWYPYGAQKGGSRTTEDDFREYRGWVSWVDKNGFRTNGNGVTPWQEDNSKSHANDFIYPKAVDAKGKDNLMNAAIREGSLFSYVAKDYATYVCPAHFKAMRDKKKVAYLSYSMNQFFRSAEAINTRIMVNLKKEPSRMVLFVELDEEDGNTSDERKGANGKTDTFVTYGNDCSWDWDEGEKGRFTHLKSGGGKKGHSHVIYLDGHVASLSGADADLDFEKLGEGKE